MARTSQTSELLHEATVVDADVHRDIDFESLAPYLDEPYASVVKHRSKALRPMSGWDPLMGGKIDTHPCRNGEDVQRVLVDDFGVDHPIVNSMMTLSSIPDSELATALMPACNDHLLDTFLDDYDHFRGLASLAPQNPEAAAEELDRMGDEDQIVGAFIASTGPSPPLGDPAYDVMYRAAEDNDLAVAYHGSAAGSFITEFRKQNQELEKFLSVHVLTHAWSQMLALTSLVVQGAPVKFPDLNFVFLEAGVSWVPYMMWRLNKEYSIRRSEAPLLNKSPEEYIRESFYFATQPIGEPNDTRQMLQMLDMMGPESVMFASDYPHWDFDHPTALEAYLRNSSSEIQERVLSGTAKEAFGLEF